MDPDVDRCVLINEKGEPLGEEYTLALAVEFLLGKCGKRGALLGVLAIPPAPSLRMPRYRPRARLRL